MKLKLKAFKRSGKYYSDYEMVIPDVPDHEVPYTALMNIPKVGLPTDFIYLGTTPKNSVPFLINL